MSAVRALDKALERTVLEAAVVWARARKEWMSTMELAANDRLAAAEQRLVDALEELDR